MVLWFVHTEPYALIAPRLIAAVSHTYDSFASAPIASFSESNGWLRGLDVFGDATVEDEIMLMKCRTSNRWGADSVHGLNCIAFTARNVGEWAFRPSLLWCMTVSKADEGRKRRNLND